MTNRSPLSNLHVVLGAGQIGSRLANLLHQRGHRVRLVQRRRPAQVEQRFEHVFGDITDLKFAESVGRDATAVYDCMNPPYHEWPKLLLALGSASLHTARTAGARLVALDCLYMYGRPNGPMTEESPRLPCSRKGKLRVELETLRLEALRSGTPVAIGRASDFFGPNLQYSAWSDRFFQRLFVGKPGECLGDPDQPHSYTFADDIARALATLGQHPEPPNGVWHLPTPPAESTRKLVRRLGQALALPDANVVRVPRLAQQALGVFIPFVREAAEMAYQWEQPFIIDDSKFVRTFGFGPTPIEQAVAATVAWAQERFGTKPRRPTP